MKFTIIIAVIAALAMQTFACSCTPSTFESRYCRKRTKVSVRVTVLQEIVQIPSGSETPEPLPFRVYECRIQSRFKAGRPRRPTIRSMFVRTPTNDPCGVELTVGGQYHLSLPKGTSTPAMDVSGPVRFPMRTFLLTACNVPTLWTDLTGDMKMFLRRARKTNGAICNA